ncbi:MAG: NRDE family protein [Alphaproteobacteria bacterium]|nr:NRDE family protein [Alphaproteobacteria bacterium]
MCTVITLRRPGHPWPLLLAANRDEMADRPWKPPARHWPDRPEVIAGLDVLAGGSWLGLNDLGVVAGILNRHGTLGPAAGRRSRGELVLEALDHADAADTARAFEAIEPTSYRPFNMIVADSRDAFWIAHRGDHAAITVEPIPEGVSMLTAHDLNDTIGSPRVARYLHRFRAAPSPDPARDDWGAWSMLLGARDADPEAGPAGAMTVTSFTGFGTSSAALIALPAPGGGRPVFRFAAGRPDHTPFAPINDPMLGTPPVD